VLRAATRSDGDVVRRVADVISRGGLAVIPTDTVYGLAVRAGDDKALRRIYDVKGREEGKPVPLLAAGLESVEAAGFILGRAERCMADAFWPGALTMVLAGARGGSEGLRVPDMDLVRELLQACGGVLRVTSANRSGEPPALESAEAIRLFGSKVDIVLDAGKVTGGVASTVVRVRGETVQVLRQGAIPSARLAEVTALRIEESPTGR